MKSKDIGIICDLDGTLYSSSMLQRRFEELYLQFIAKSMGKTWDGAGEIVEGVRQELTQRNAIEPSEFAVLRELKLAPIHWLNYCSRRVCPEQYLKPNSQLVAIVRRARAAAWFDVTTNTGFRLASRILRAIGLCKYLDGLWAPDTGVFTEGKPNLDLYKHISCLRGLRHSSVLVLGDRWHIDLVNVERIGMESRLVNGPQQTEKAIEEFLIAHQE